VKTFLNTALAAGAVAVLIAAMYFLFSRPCREPACSAGYDAAALKRTDPALVLESSLKIIRPRMTNLAAIAVDRGGNIYAGSDAGVEILDSNGTHVASFTAVGPVRCLAVTPDNLVLAGGGDSVAVYAGDGALEKTFCTGAPESMITSVVGASNFVFAADCARRVIWRFDRAGGAPLVIGERDGDQRKAGFVVPSVSFDLAAAADGSLWAVNPGEHRLEHFSGDGRFISSWGKAGLAAPEFCGCCNPAHIALGPGGSFVTSEKHIVRIKVYDKSGVFKGVVCGAEDWPGEAAAPDIAVDPAGRVLALDRRANAIRIYTLATPW